MSALVQSKTQPSNLKCKLCKTELERIQRNPLMKLIPASRHYRCPACDTHFFKYLGMLQKC